jgi:hypothetical protein
MRACCVLRRKLRRFRALATAAKPEFIRAICALPLATLAFRLFGVTRVRSWLCQPRAVPPGVSRMEPDQCDVIVRVAARQLPWAPNCLARAVVTEWLLARHGVRCELRVGVARTDGKFSAHAWIEYGGRALGEDDPAQQGFAAFDPLPHRAGEVT